MVFKSQKKALLIRIFSAILLHSVFLLTYSQEEYIPELNDPVQEKWNWTSFDNLDDLGVLCMEFDHKENAWFGLSQGVIRYDGYEWQTFFEEHEILQAPVYDILSDKTNTLYVISTRGICTYQNGNWEGLVYFPDTISGWTHWQHTSSIKLSDSSICIPTIFGLFVFKGTEKTLIASKETLKIARTINEDLLIIEFSPGNETESDQQIFSLVEDENKTLWFALLNGIIGKFTSKTINWHHLDSVEIFRVTNDLNYIVPFLFIDSQNQLLVSFFSDFFSVYKYNRQVNEFEVFMPDSELLYSMELAGDSTLWMGCLGKLISYKDGLFKSYSQPEYPISESRIYLKSSQKDLWVIGLRNNVSRLSLDQKKYKSYKDLNFFVEDKSEAKWFINGSGEVICQLPKRDKWLKYSTDDGVIDAPVSIYSDSKGRIWIIGSHKNRAAFTIITENNISSKIFKEICWGLDHRAFFETSTGTIYLGAASNCNQAGGKYGILKYKPEKGGPLETGSWEYYSDDKLGFQSYSFAETKNGTILSGYWEGLLEFHDTSSVFINWLFSADVTSVDFMTQGIEGEVWIGTRGSGIIRFFSKDNWTKYTTKDGLANNKINGILVARDSSVYASTSKGISRFDGKQWQTHAFSSEIKVLWESGSLRQSSDGMIWINLNSRDWNRRVYHEIRNDKMKFPELVTYGFLPDSIPPKTAITYFEEEISPKGNALIKWEGLDFWNKTEKDKLEFSYQLDNNEWSRFTTGTSHLFLSLKSGHHTFRVRARNKNFITDHFPPTIEFKVLAPIWRRTWFLISVFFVISMIIYYQIKQFRLNKYLLLSNKTIHNNNLRLEEQTKELNQNNYQLKKKQKMIEEQTEELLSQRDVLYEINTVLEEKQMKIEEQTEELKTQRDELLRVNSTKDRLFSIIAHDLKNPFTILSGYLDMFLRKYDIISDDKRKHMLKAAITSASNIQNLLINLLSWARSQTGNIRLNKREININELIQENVDLVSDQAKEKDITIQYASPAIETTLSLDQNLMNTIIRNLLSNAIKFTQSKGAVKIEAFIEDQNFILSVEDTGVGISKDGISKLFKRGVLHTTPGTDNETGTGIGLSTCLAFVEMHKGKISVESEEGKGSVFTLVIPV